MMSSNVVRKVFSLGMLAGCFVGCGHQPPQSEVPKSTSKPHAASEVARDQQPDSQAMPVVPSKPDLLNATQVQGPVAATVSERPEWPLIEAIRASPWDAAAVAALADWYADRDPPRSELVKLQASAWTVNDRVNDKLAVDHRINDLLNEHLSRWTEPAMRLGVSPSVYLKCGLIDEIRCTGVTDEQIAALANIPELRVLDLCSPKLTLKGFETVVRLPQLDRLTVDGTELSPSHLSLLEQLPPRTSVRLYTDNLDRDAVVKMNATRIAKLEKLSKDEQYSAGVRFLATFDGGIQFGKRLTAANLSQAGITDAEMKLLAPLTDLTAVFISECSITDAGIAQLAGMKDLQHLSLFQTMVTSLESLAGLTKLESLEVFPDYDVKMSDDGIAVIEHFTQLDDLYLGEGDFGDATVLRLSGLSKLKKLDLTLSRLDDPTCLSAMVGLTEMRSLSLHGKGIPDSVFEHFTGMNHLERLSIGVGKGTGGGLRHLAGLTGLRLLYLSGKGVTDLGLPDLASLKNVELIMAQGSAITPEGAQQLADKLPRVTIILDDAVVKSPRQSYTMTRQRLEGTVSILLPHDWFEKPTLGDSSMLVAKEDGWKEVGGWSSETVGPVEMTIYLDADSQTPEEAMMASVNNNSHLNPKVLQKNVVKLPGIKDAMSCVYQNDHGKHLVLAVKSPDGFAVLDCEAKPGRFDEFRPLFDAVAQSVRVDSNPDVHKNEVVELPVKSKP